MTIKLITKSKQKDELSNLKSTLTNIRSSLEKELNNTFSAIDAMSFYVTTHPDFSEREFHSMASALYSTSGNLKNIALAPNFVIDHVYPKKGNEKIIGINYRDISDQWQDVKLAVDENRTVVAGPIKLIQGGRGLIVRSPVIVDKFVWGIVSAVVDFDKIIGMVNLYLPENSILEIYKQSNISEQLDLIYSSGDSGNLRFFITNKLNVADTNWEIKLFMTTTHQSLLIDYIFLHLLFVTVALSVLGSLIYSNKKRQLLIISEKRFKDFAKCSADWVWEVNSNGVYVYVSESVIDVLGYTQGEVLGKTPFDFMTNEESKRVEKIFQEALQKQAEIDDLENWHLTKADQEVCVLTNAVPLIDDKGVVIGYRGVDKDITQRKIWEDTVEKSKKQLEIIFDTTREGIAIMDNETNFIHCNKAYLNMTGYSLDELLNKSCVELTLESDRDKSEKIILEVLEKGVVEFFEKTCVKKDGALIDVQMSFSLMPDQQSILVSAKDVTALKSAQKLIDENNKLLDLFFDQSMDGFFFMMLPEAIDWAHSENKGELLDYIFENQKITKINDAMLSQYKANEEDFIGLTPNDFFAHDLEQGKKVWNEFFDKGRLHVDTCEKRFDGSDVYIQGDYICIYDEDGFIKGHFGVQRDVTEARHNEEELKKYIKIVDEDVIISQTDLNGFITYASEAFCIISGYSKEELLGENHNIVRHPETPSALFEEMWSTITSGDKWKGEIKNLKKGGGFYWVDTYIVPLQDINGSRTGYMAVRQDITAKKELEVMSVTDKLTGLFNRSKLDSAIQKEHPRFIRYGHAYSVIIFDIDHFKKVNDTYGHLIGDYVLKEIAKISNEHTRETDIVGRWGGEEFLVICPDTDLDGAFVLAENLRSAIENYKYEHVEKITSSFGVASSSGVTEYEVILKKADDALYQSKQTGRNKVTKAT